MNSTRNNVLYWSDTMTDNAPGLEDQITKTRTSGFTSVLLWSLHVKSVDDGVAMGDFYWNTKPIVVTQGKKTVFDPEHVFTRLAERLRALLSGGTVQRILFSIGGGGTKDFSNVAKMLQTESDRAILRSNFAALQDALPGLIVGYDFDDEDDTRYDTIVGFTKFLYENFKSTITYCPCYESTLWNRCLEGVYAALNTQPVAWWNLQCYSGGIDNVPANWVKVVADKQITNGVADSRAYIVPGYAAMNKQQDGPGKCPDEIQEIFSTYKNLVPGGFIWNSRHVFCDGVGQCGGSTATLEQYAQAINNGLATS